MQPLKLGRVIYSDFLQKNILQVFFRNWYECSEVIVLL